MKILFISQYFLPEMGAPALRTYELAKHWAASGHDVTVLAAFPHHPTGIVPEKYRGRFIFREEIDGIHLVRTYVYAVPNQGVFKRTLSYLSFMFSAILSVFFLKDKFEIVIATSPQFFVAIAGYVISKMKRLPFVLEIRDLWPESIQAVGAIHNRFVLRFLSGIANFLYQEAHKIVVVAKSSQQILIERGIPAGKIELIPNGVDLDRFGEPTLGDTLRDTYSLNDKFVVSYVGTHGMAHALHCVLDAANLLRDVNTIHFLFVGDGAKKEALITYSEQLSLSNVTFVGQQDMALVPSFLALSDVSLVSLSNTPLFASVLPSKMFEIMAARRPIIMCIPDGEASCLLEEAQAGLAVLAEDSELLKEAILKLYHHRELGQMLGENGYRYVLHYYQREILAQKYISCLQGLVEDQRISKSQ